MAIEVAGITWVSVFSTCAAGERPLHHLCEPVFATKVSSDGSRFAET